MDHVLDTIANLLKQNSLVQVATVFGSIARGRARTESDVDIAVAANRSLSSEEKMQLIEHIALATGRPVDLVDLTTASGPILQQALSHGRIVKCADRALYAHLMLRMLYNQADDMRYRKRILEQRQRTWTQA